VGLISAENDEGSRLDSSNRDPAMATAASRAERGTGCMACGLPGPGTA